MKKLMLKAILTTLFGLLFYSAVAQKQEVDWMRYDRPSMNNSYALPADFKFSFNDLTGFSGSNEYMAITLINLNNVLSDDNKKLVIKKFMEKTGLSELPLWQTVSSNGYKIIEAKGTYNGKDIEYYLYTDPKYTSVNFAVCIRFDSKRVDGMGSTQTSQFVMNFKPLEKMEVQYYLRQL